MRNETTPAELTTAVDDTPCAARLYEVVGRDRAVAARLRAEAASLLKLAETLELNASLAVSAAADLLAEQP